MHFRATQCLGRNKNEGIREPQQPEALTRQSLEDFKTEMTAFVRQSLDQLEAQMILRLPQDRQPSPLKSDAAPAGRCVGDFLTVLFESVEAVHRLVHQQVEQRAKLESKVTEAHDWWERKLCELQETQRLNFEKTQEEVLDLHKQLQLGEQKQVFELRAQLDEQKNACIKEAGKAAERAQENEAQMGKFDQIAAEVREIDQRVKLQVQEQLQTTQQMAEDAARHCSRMEEQLKRWREAHAEEKEQLQTAQQTMAGDLKEQAEQWQEAQARQKEQLQTDQQTVAEEMKEQLRATQRMAADAAQQCSRMEEQLQTTQQMAEDVKGGMDVVSRQAADATQLCSRMEDVCRQLAEAKAKQARELTSVRHEIIDLRDQIPYAPCSSKDDESEEKRRILDSEGPQAQISGVATESSNQSQGGDRTPPSVLSARTQQGQPQSAGSTQGARSSREPPSEQADAPLQSRAAAVPPRTSSAAGRASPAAGPQRASGSPPAATPSPTSLPGPASRGQVSTTQRSAAQPPQTGAERQPIFTEPPHPDEPEARRITMDVEEELMALRAQGGSTADKQALLRKLNLKVHPDKGKPGAASHWLTAWKAQHGHWYVTTNP